MFEEQVQFIEGASYPLLGGGFTLVPMPLQRDRAKIQMFIKRSNTAARSAAPSWLISFVEAMGCATRPNCGSGWPGSEIHYGLPFPGPDGDVRRSRLFAATKQVCRCNQPRRA